MEQKGNVVLKFGFYIVLTGLIVYSAYSIISASRDMYWDFPNYYVSSKLISQGQDPALLYDDQWFDEQAKSMGIEHTSRFTPFPPITSIVMLPLVLFEPMTAKIIWLLVNCIVLFLTIRILIKTFHFDLLLSLLVVFSLGISLANNFKLGQFYLICTFGLFYVYDSFKKSKWHRSGAILSLLASIKYFPVVFLYGLFNRKFLISFTLTGLLLLAVQLTFFGPETFESYLQILNSHLNGKIADQGTHSVAFQSIDSFLANVFVTNEALDTSAIFNWPIGKVLGKYLFITIILGISFRMVKRLKEISPERQRDSRLLITGMAFLTILPASASYHFILLLFPFALLLKITLGKIPLWQSILLFVLYLIVANTGMNTIPFRFGIPFLDLLLSYPRFIGMLLLFIATTTILKRVNSFDHTPNQVLSHKLLLSW